jgi:O-antigen ligase
MVAAAPWAFGGVHPVSELALYALLALGLALWAVRLLLEGAPVRFTCPVALCLAGMVLLGVAQLVPLPRAWAERLSPAAANLREQLTPSQPEIFPDTAADPAASTERGVPLSLYPGGTREAVVRLLAVLALFVLVRNNLASPRSLRRLAVVAVVNGALLALLALTQYFTSPPYVVYWHWETQGLVFGPFICRNHFPLYVNMCVGLGIGLLLATRSDRRRHRTDWVGWLIDLGNHPATLWIGAALALMVAAVVVSLSRGGMVALAVAAVVCAVVRVAVTGRFSGLGVAALLLLVPGLGLVAWLGTERVEKRVATLWKSDVLAEGRGPLWARLLPRVRDNPVWGSGYGTHELVEPLGRRPTEATIYFFSHAHNDYLEALVEGGVIQLLLGLTAVVLVVRAAWRAYAQTWMQPAGSLVLGGLFAFVTVAVHSFTDFGLHMPANAILATVLAAHLSGMVGREPAASSSRFVVSLTTAAAASAVAGLLVTEGWKAERAERFRLAARRCMERNTAQDRDRAIEYLTDAQRYTPHNVMLQVQLAAAYEAVYDAERERLVRDRRVAAAASAVAEPGSTGMPFLFLSALDADRWPVAAESQLVRRHLLPAVHQYVAIRDACPLMVVAHVRLATYGRLLVRADVPAAYLARACLLAPAHDRVWFLAGSLAMNEGRPADAWDCWRHSLRCTDRYLADVLVGGAGHPELNELLVTTIRDDRTLLVRAADTLPDALSIDSRPAALAALLAAAERVDRPLAAEELRAKSRLHVLLEQSEEAERALAAAVAAAPERSNWRRELAALRASQSMSTVSGDESSDRHR